MTFDDVLTIKNGKNQRAVENANGRYPIYGSGGIMGYADDFICNPDTVIIGRKGNINKPIFVEEPFWNVDTAFGLEADKSVLLPKYLFYFCLKYDFERHNKAVTIPSLTKADLLKIEIELPSLKTQEDIVNQLDAISRTITLREEQLSKCDDLIKARFVEMFGNIHENRFPKCKLREVAHIKHGYAFSGEFFSDDDNGIVLVTPGNFAIGGGFQETKNRYFTSGYDEEYVLHPGDLIVTMTDLSKKADTLGYGAIVPNSDKVYLHNQRIGLFDRLDEKLNSVFVRWYMQTDEYRSEIVRTSTGSTVHHTSPDRILDSTIYLPPIEDQNKFVAFAEQVDKSKSVVQKSLDEAQLLFDSLMQKYFG